MQRSALLQRDAKQAAFRWLSQPFTVIASGWMGRVKAASGSMVAMRRQRHIVVRSLPTNPKRLNNQTGIGNRGAFLPITSR